MTRREVANYLRVSPLTIFYWANKGILPSVKINKRGDMRFKKEEIDKYLEKLNK